MTSFEAVTVNGDSDRAHEVLIGPGLSDELSSRVPTDVRKILITHPPVLHTRAEALRDLLAGNREVFLAEIPDGEPAKRIEVASFLWGLLGQLEFGRSDLIIGFGGGATTDLSGFVAANWLRGIRSIQIPTTVLGMVDAAIGGKSGINTAEGKNLVGAFHAPILVVCDTDYLATLPENDIKAGLAEVIKCGFIKDPAILDLVEKHPDAIITPGSAELAEAITRTIRVKADIVGVDFTERGPRETLNYGHTLGHAIEHAERYTWRHGAAVSIGMVFAAELSRMVAGLDDDAVDRHRALLGSLGLPLDYPADRWQTLLATMQRDKKSRQGVLRFVVLDQVGSARVLAIPDESVLFAAYQELVAGQSV